MANKQVINNLISSGDETDSADEVYAFTRKRKPHSFFIDLTEEEIESKRRKKNVSFHSDGDAQVFDGESEVQVLKVVPPDSATCKEIETCEVSSTDKSPVQLMFSQVKVNRTTFCSPPPIVRIANADLSKSSNVIDLTKGGAANKECADVLSEAPTAQPVIVGDEGAETSSSQKSLPPKR